MDNIDRKIIGTLLDAGRLTLQELADRVHLGASATRERLRRLERDGVITGYRAVVDLERLGFAVDALVDVDLAPGADPIRFETGLRTHEAVTEALHATGDHDYLVRVRCRDTTELHRVVRALKQDLGAARTQTRVILDRPVPRRSRKPLPARAEGPIDR